MVFGLEPITVTTSADIIYQRRVRWLELVAELGDVSAACRRIGVSRTRYYEWNKIVADYGIEALWPKSRRWSGHVRIPPRSPNHNAVGERLQGHHAPGLADGVSPAQVHSTPSPEALVAGSSSHSQKCWSTGRRRENRCESASGSSSSRSAIGRPQPSR